MPGAAVEWTSASGGLEMLEVSLPAGWAGRRLTGLNQGTQARVVAMTRADEARIVEDEVGQEGDVLYILVEREARAALADRLGIAL